MNAFNSLVKTIWIVMVLLIFVGFLIADRYRIVQELTECRQNKSGLEIQLSETIQQCQATIAAWDKALAEEKARCIGIQEKAEELQQRLASKDLALAYCLNSRSAEVYNPAEPKSADRTVLASLSKTSSSLKHIFIALDLGALAILGWLLLPKRVHM